MPSYDVTRRAAETRARRAAIRAADADERLAEAVADAQHTAMVEAGRDVSLPSADVIAAQLVEMQRNRPAVVRELAALRAALSQAEAERTQADTYIGEMAETLARLTAERTSLRQVITDLLGSADCAWEDTGGGHDWREAVAAARAALGVRDAKE